MRRGVAKAAARGFGRDSKAEKGASHRTEAVRPVQIHREFRVLAANTFVQRGEIEFRTGVLVANFLELDNQIIQASRKNRQIVIIFIPFLNVQKFVNQNFWQTTIRLYSFGLRCKFGLHFQEPLAPSIASENHSFSSLLQGGSLSGDSQVIDSLIQQIKSSTFKINFHKIADFPERGHCTSTFAVQGVISTLASLYVSFFLKLD